MTTAEIIRVVVFASSIAGLVILFTLALRKPSVWLYTVPPVLLLLNLAVFTAARMLAGHTLPPYLIPLFNQWSNIIQLQLAFTVAGIGGYYLWTRR